MGDKMYLESWKIAAPMGILMLVGCLIKVGKISAPSGQKIMDDIVYRVFMPALLFYNIVSCPNLGQIGGRFFVLSTALIAIGVIGVALFLRKRSKGMRVSMLIGICRTNMSVYGSAISLAMLGPTNAKLAMLYLSFAVAIQNVILVSTLEIMESSILNPLHIFMQIIKNPQIAAAIVAVALNLLGVQLPSLILSPLSDIAHCATPIAFIMLGSSFHISQNRVDNLGIFLVVFARLIFIPAVLLLPAVALFKVQGTEMVALCCIIATPCAVSSLPLSNEFGGNTTVTNESIVYTSILSIVTLPLFMSLCQFITQ